MSFIEDIRIFIKHSSIYHYSTTDTKYFFPNFLFEVKCCQLIIVNNLNFINKKTGNRILIKSVNQYLVLDVIALNGNNLILSKCYGSMVITLVILYFL